jgi:sRNA-binding carbon storage regulator CsrA
LFDTFETQIRGAMEKYLLNLDNSQIMAIAAAVTVAQIDTRGDEARVTLTNPKTGELMRLQMRRQVERDRWQIVSVNYQDLKRFLQREFR